MRLTPLLPGAALLALILSFGCRNAGPEPAATQPSDNSSSRRPNIVYIMADDMGYADLSGYGRKDYETPALDRLAAEGMRFTQAYAIAPVCTPTRVGLMTGRYPARTRAGLWEPLRTSYNTEGLDTSSSVLARRLRDAGYHTGLVGKWHLGWEPRFSPSEHGFDSWFAIMSGGADYVLHRATDPSNPAGDHDLYQDGQPVRKDGYLTDLFTEGAEAFLRTAREPFFLNLEYTAPHWPWQQRGDAGYPADKNPATHGGSPEIYAGMMRALDDGVARVLKALEETGHADDTIVIFTSDNGGEIFSDMGPLSGMKQQLWEGGIRVPAFVRWPGVTRPGQTSNQVITTLDWTATMLAAGGASDGADLDGIDLQPHLRGDAPVSERTVFWRANRLGPQRAVRQGTWKYLRIDKQPPAGRMRPDTGEFLFDLEADPGEATNLARVHPDVVERLRKLYAEWEAGVPAPIEPVPPRPATATTTSAAATGSGAARR
jgi:arylsulfatase A-like enzyme